MSLRDEQSSADIYNTSEINVAAVSRLNIVPRTNRLSFVDGMFSTFINTAQSTIVKLGVSAGAARKMHARSGATEVLSERIASLGLKPERLWWGTMTLAPRKARFLLDEIERHPPSQVLEVGAGTSTAILAAAARHYGFNVLSLENHSSTLDYVAYLLEGIDVSNHLVMQHCGFVRRRYPDGKKYRWYNADLSALCKPIDFVLIDGPMGTLVGRNGALPEIVPQLSKDHRIYLDDCKRRHEQACIREWMNHYPGLTAEIPESSGIFSVRVPSEFLDN